MKKAIVLFAVVAAAAVQPRCSVKNVNVGASAAFAVAGSGTATVNGGSLTLEDGATLKFNFTDRKTAPVLNLAD